MVIRRGGGERVVPAEDYFVGPDINIMRMTVLRPGELLTAIRIPGTWAGAQFYFEKVRDRQVWDFPLVNVASAMKTSGTTIQAARLAVGAVAARPLRLTAVEQAVAGQPRNEETATRAGELAIAGRGAAALQRLQGAADAQPRQARHPRPGAASNDVATLDAKDSAAPAAMRARGKRIRGRASAYVPSVVGPPPLSGITLHARLDAASAPRPDALLLVSREVACG